MDAAEHGAPMDGGAPTATLTEESGPFVGGGLTLAADPASTETGRWVDELGRLASPFADGMRPAGEVDDEADAVDTFVRELDDEAFEAAIEDLIDEVAARHLSSVPSWSSESDGPMLASTDAENWMAAQAAKVDRYLEHLEHQFADRSVESLTEEEIDSVVDQLAADDTLTGASEELFGGLVKKVFKGAKALARKGIQLAGKLIPVGRIIAIVRRMIPSLLNKVVQKGINLLPKKFRGPARQLARGLQSAAAPGSGAEVAEEFDDQFARAILAPNESAADQILTEADDETAQPTVEPLAALDEARARLTRQLAEATPGEPPVAPIEQFIPAVMAAMPLIKKGISILGLRPKIKGVLAKGLALLIKNHVGPQVAQALAPRIADAGLKLLGLETAEPAMLGAEALVSTLEDTIREVVELPDESLEEPLRLQAEVEHAFTQAAARYLPREVLRADVATFETDDEGAVWVPMPRVVGPRYRYRKCARVYRVPIGRAQARAIVLDGEDTLEERLLDGGVAAWPVEAEVHLYEAMPGTHLGHLAAFETDEPQESNEPLRTDEFEELTPEVASMLLGRPGLGRHFRRSHRGRLLRPGHRLFRVAVPGVQVRRRQRRLVIKLDVTRPQPTLRLHLRLSEREGHTVAGAVAKNTPAAVMALLRKVLGTRARQRLAERLAKQSQRALGAPLPEGRGAALAGQLAESMLTTVAKQLPTAAATLGNAARDPAAGLTLTFAFTFPNKAAIGTAAPEAPTLTIRPGYRRD